VRAESPKDGGGLLRCRDGVAFRSIGRLSFRFKVR
jgi:hypothetical protein